MIPLLVSLGTTLGLGVVLLAVPALRSPLTRAASGPRWRADAVPVSGGIAMAAGFAAAVVVSATSSPGAGGILAASGLLLVVGVVDDLHPLRPEVKLIGQGLAGLVLAAGGVRPVLPGGAVVEVAAVVVWVVVVCNAMNLLDGMDGLAGGVALIAGTTLWAWNVPAPMMAAFVGAVAGFLPFNLRPARMFMGNGGSHWVGAVLAANTILDAGRGGGSTALGAWAVILVPAVLLAVPLFDTTLVVVERLRHGRPVTVGGTDHTSHRLVAAGLGQGWAVSLLWGLGLAAAGAASLIQVGPAGFAAGSAVLAVGFVVLGVRLDRVDVYG